MCLQEAEQGRGGRGVDLDSVHDELAEGILLVTGLVQYGRKEGSKQATKRICQVCSAAPSLKKGDECWLQVCDGEFDIELGNCTKRGSSSSGCGCGGGGELGFDLCEPAVI